jgi:hypothetical protein
MEPTLTVELSYITRVGSSLALNYYTRVKILAMTNALAYYGTTCITAVKRFIVSAPGIVSREKLFQF